MNSPKNLVDASKRELSILVTLRKYRKVASSRMSRFVAHFHISRLIMKGNFDAYVKYGPKLNSRPVYCLRLYGTYLEWNKCGKLLVGKLARPSGQYSA